MDAFSIGRRSPWLQLAPLAGLKAGRIVESFDCSRRTSPEQKLSKDLRAMAVNFYAQR